MRYKDTIISLLMFLAATAVQGQINISGKVFGGARQADVGGSTFINIGADNCDVIIDAVYGGNDISGSIGASEKIPTTIFTEAVANGLTVADGDDKDKNQKGFNSFIRTNVEGTGKHLFIGKLFGGGYGDYKYTRYTEGQYIEKYKVESWDVTWKNGVGSRTLISTVVDNLPLLNNAYLELCGGTFGYAYGGGDSVTVTNAAEICIDNTSTRTKINGETGGLASLNEDRLKEMGINTEYFNKIANHETDVDKFLFSRVFGGNNKADMRIRPKWHLKAGSIENLYSGGNEGRMTSEEGILLDIGVNSQINVYNVYGGCRKADVCPETSPGVAAATVKKITEYSFPDNLAARVVVGGGKIHNVYGGNDVRGRVYFGNAVGIRTTISGDVYGGGNGSYPYTDNKALANDLIYGDFYYNPIEVLGLKDGEGNPQTSFTQLESAQALNAIRPNAEQVSIRITDARVTDDMSDEAFNALKSTPVIIGGSVYCGGNSATLKEDANHRGLSDNYPLVELKIGSNIIVDKVFLGNNGANMVDQSDGGLLAQYHGDVTPADGGTAVDFSTLNLETSDIFKEYMKGCALDIIPSVNFDSKKDNKDAATYRDYSAYIGSFYCGGNVGSMTYNDVKPMKFNKKVIIFDKLVGGCNNAIIPAKSGVNAAYEGGLTGTANITTGNKVELTLAGIRMEPKRWTTDSNGKKNGLEWNTIDSSTGQNTDAIEAFTEAELANLVLLKDKDNNPVLDDNGQPVKYLVSDDDDLNRRFMEGHIYGGCYSSGIVNGNVVINIDSTLIEREKLFDVVKTDELGEEESLYGSDQTQQVQFKILKRNTGVLLGQQGMDVLGAALNVFGGGKGKATEIWGSTTINLNGGYTFQIFGGSEEGVIGKPDDGTGDAYTYSYKLKYIGTDTETSEITKTYKYNDAYSCYVNLCGEKDGVSKNADTSEQMAQCEFMYGGGFFGPICGNTYVNLGRGRIFNSFAGSCNADILGHTETYIGRMVRPGTKENPYLYKNALSIHRNEENYYTTYYTEGFPWVRDYTYGGNDLGGLIKQEVDFSGRVRETGTGDGAFDVLGKVHLNNTTEVLKANAYTEYWQGHAEGIFAGCYGTYDYTDSKFKDYFYTTGGTGTTPENIGTPRRGNNKPYMVNAIVNFRPTYSKANNLVNKIYGAGQGYPGEKDRDHLQDRSYVLIDIPQDMTYYKEMEVFGAGAWSGVGMRTVIWPNLAPTAEELKELDGHSTIIDLVRGQIGAVYGGSYEEGLTRRTVVNIPAGSTIMAGSIFGGAYGMKTLPTCDVLDANVEYHSADAVLVYDPASSELYQGSIYGGNNNERRTLSTYVNIDVPVVQKKVIQYDKEVGNYPKGYELWTNGTVYGAGRGVNTWAEYTMVDLKSGAKVWEVYGGGQLGHVLNAQTVQAYMQAYQNPNSPSPDIDPSEYAGMDWATAWKKAWTMDIYYTPNDNYNDYATFIATQLNAARPRTELDAKTKALLGGSGSDKTFFNTNVIINEGATVMNYAYGGGLGKTNLRNSGDVWGTTYIALLGGTVKKDLYAAGTCGGVYDAFNIGAYATNNPLGFTASSNAYIKGGTARNVYGGGWEGSVGKHKKFVTEDEKQVEVNAEISYSYANDIYGETHVVIGDLDGTSFVDGLPAIERNAYGGGEGGAVFGTTNLTMRNGFIGYRHFDSEPTADTDLGTIKVDYTVGETAYSDYYQEKLHDETWTGGDGTNRLNDSGCIFGGGYIDNSSVDKTFVKMYNGHVRNALFGGGEIAAVGRGVIEATGNDKSIRTLTGIYKAGKTQVELYDGYVHRNVFGGGRGYNNLGESGKLYSDGYVFGQTEVHIHGGEVGTVKELAKGNGNVFGGGDIGYVYSAYELEDGTLRRGTKDGARYDGLYEGYYYEHKGKLANGSDETNVSTDGNGFIMYTGNERKLTEDCKVLIEPHCKVKAANGASFTLNYKVGDVFTLTDLNYLRDYNETHTPTVPVDTISSKIDVKGKVTAEFSFTLTYNQGEYVPTFAMNTLGDKDDSAWADLEANTNDDGIIIMNAVFAGGNTSSGSSKAYANATSVFGNATASVHDVYHRDLISIGRGQTGGLYGDGNLTFVNGYRGLNITNYGTDYNYLYGRKGHELTYEEYEALLDREQDYYEIRYKCVKACTDKDGTSYHTGVDDGFSSASTLNGDQIMALFKNVPNPEFKENEPESETNKRYKYEVPTGFYNADGTINTDKDNGGYWVQNGVCSIYAGRLMNTIQRADFCGVFGSRMVMKGAEDRVPEVVDYTNYTINRVREVSLNKKVSIRTEDRNSGTDDDKAHGNYFGIYNIVNFLGALTSDFDFGDQGTNSDVEDATGSTDNKGDTYSTGGVRTSDNTRTDEYQADYEGQTFYGWKRAHSDEQKRNNGNSHNKVALASGVYLELTTEESTGKEIDEKEWGLITGVVELDLIDVQPGIGGGFVYAKNVHGKRTRTNHINTTLTSLNAGAVTRFDFDYKDPETNPSSADQRVWQTSGNFVHSTQTIIDDCYNVSGKYVGSDRVPAHYWYVKGRVYVYDQYISAYTGVSNAYTETVDIPLTISAASNGTMTLMQVKPNKYAYKNTNGEKLEEGKKIVINDVEYYLNTPINYWDWSRLTPSEQALFVDETYVISDSCKIGDNWYAPGYVMLKDEYNSFKSATIYKASKDADGNNMVVKDKEDNSVVLAFDDVFHSSNNMSHDTGYMLTYKVNNPVEWNTWYTKESSATHEKQQTEYTETCHNGPTYYLKGLDSGQGTLLGQRKYEVGNLISEEVETTYQTVKSNHPNAIPPSDPQAQGYDANKVQAEFDKAYILTKQETVTETDGTTHHLYPGHVVSASDVTTFGLNGSVVEAYVCTKSIQISPTRFIYVNNKMTEDDKNDYIQEVNDTIKNIHTALKNLTYEELNAKTDLNDFGELILSQLTKAQQKELASMLSVRRSIDERVVKAYYCKKAGLYGGNYYEGGKNYRGLDVFSSMSETDRGQFTFNYDALDLLIDPTYSGTEGMKYQYDGMPTKPADGAKPGYSITQPVDYTATYNGNDTGTYNGVALEKNKEYTRQQYESLPNERRHYAPITVKESDISNGTYTAYVVKSNDVVIGNTPYAEGSILPASDYNDDLASKVTQLTLDSAGTYYYCRESYTVGEKGSGESVKAVIAVDGVCDVDDTKTNNETVPVGFVIAEGTDDGLEAYTYKHLVNKQLDFTVHGKAPMETSTFYVSRFSDIKDLSTEKIITVVYRYDYEESDKLGNHITPVSERHVVNIHITFKSGLPEVEDIKAPQMVIPGDYVGLREPNVIPGANEITGGGWELYERKEDAESRSNAIPFTPTIDPLYWYQNDYYVRYYCLTNIGGKSYSNAVQVNVANYHDLKKVMEAKNHHYYIDHENVDRDPKIYINDYSDDATGSKSGLDLLKDLFNLSIGEGPDGHAALNTSQVGGCKNLEFILKSNQSPQNAWTSIGKDAVADNPETTDVDESAPAKCFDGVLHGDGYTISGLTSSLFSHLCGEVYNLGVTGSFTGAGIAEEGSGYVENTWVSTSSTKAKTNKPVFGSPSRTDEQEAKYGKIQIVNSYYQEDDNAATTVASDDATKMVAYPNHSGEYGEPKRMTAKAFYNGTVAYNLNAFYLYKRYCDKEVTSGTDYQFYDGTIDPETNALVPKTKSYASNPELCSSGYTPEEGYVAPRYVEDRFADGDFIYSAGTIPGSADKRLYIDPTTKAPNYYPVWPDDYLFFGQTLDYGYTSGRTHQDVPSRITTANRVLRAPAYFRSYDMDVAHFNADAVIVGKEKLTFEQTNNNVVAREVYPRMTAIDFTGYNDSNKVYHYKKGWSTWSKTSQQAQSAGMSTEAYAFYPPLLDDGVVSDGLNSFTCGNLTRNLLVYTGAPGGTGTNETPTAAQRTANAVGGSDDLVDAAYDEHKTDNPYNTVTVKQWDESSGLRGHWVRKSDSGTGFIATRDHYLVDKEDFNAPMAYTFQSGNRMWHQRRPDNYVSLTKGWEAISLPFTAEIVTTDDKGEITHFYKKTESTTYDDKYDIGHEYWLREFKEMSDPDGEGISTATMNYPDAVTTDKDKEVDNTFLWDYYYKGVGHSQKDKNSDTYQGDYYKESRTYPNYPLLTGAVPYIIGFPSRTYYEFDLSGEFTAGTAAATQPAKLGKQTITFAAPTTGITIGVSDFETVKKENGTEAGVTYGGYTFKPTYLNMDMDAGTNSYALAADGGSYDKVPATGDATPVTAFRPYFIKMPAQSSVSKRAAQYIQFSNNTSQLGGDENLQDDLTQYMEFAVKKNAIVVTSHMRSVADVGIYSVSGVCLASFDIQPEETIETPINTSGVYIVRAARGHYTKKVTIK